MKLYKFRPLAEQVDFNRAKQILETNHFWCSQFSELNDPMEGVFSITRSRYVNKIIDEIYNEKSKYKICSFSGKEAFENPPMWGYYANGFKGIAIEIEVDEGNVEKIKYDDIESLEDSADANNIKKILTTKLTPWKHEAEYRFLIMSEKNYHEIGKITSVYFGNPYGDVVNKEKIYERNKGLLEYDNLKKQLIKISQGIRCYHIKIEGTKVVRGETL